MMWFALEHDAHWVEINTEIVYYLDYLGMLSVGAALLFLLRICCLPVSPMKMFLSAYYLLRAKGKYFCISFHFRPKQILVIKTFDNEIAAYQK